MPELKPIPIEDVKKLKIPKERLRSVCHYRCGPGACRYIMHVQVVNDLCCVKHFRPGREIIEREFDEMKARGDNCPGLRYDQKSA